MFVSFILIVVAVCLLALFIQAEINHRQTSKRLDAHFHRLGFVECQVVDIHDLTREAVQHSLAWAQATSELRDLLYNPVDELDEDDKPKGVTLAEITEIFSRRWHDVEDTDAQLEELDTTPGLTVDEHFDRARNIVLGSN